MLNYVNSIFCAYNELEKNLIIKMRQEIPADTGEENPGVETQDIISIVMSRELAMRLVDNINTICGLKENE